MPVLNKNFYNQNTLIVAKSLLGCRLCRKKDGQILAGKIVETEAYTQNDPACHAFKGKTKRAITLFKKPGLAYVYLIYGMYHCVNVVTEEEGTAGAVLIRALEPIHNIENTNGPGKLCREMYITREFNETDLTSTKNGLWIEKNGNTCPQDIIETTRIGITQAKEYPWRFYLKNNIYVSKI